MISFFFFCNFVFKRNQELCQLEKLRSKNAIFNFVAKSWTVHTESSEATTRRKMHSSLQINDPLPSILSVLSVPDPSIDTLIWILPLRSVWSAPQSFGINFSHRLCAFIWQPKWIDEKSIQKASEINRTL